MIQTQLQRPVPLFLVRLVSLLLITASLSIAGAAQQTGSAENWLERGNALTHAGRWREASTAYQQALILKPDMIETHNNLGFVYTQLDSYAEAAASFEQALRLNPLYALARYNLGNVYLRLQRHTEALAQLRQAIKLKPGYASAYNDLGNALGAVS